MEQLLRALQMFFGWLVRHQNHFALGDLGMCRSKSWNHNLFIRRPGAARDKSMRAHVPVFGQKPPKLSRLGAEQDLIIASIAEQAQAFGMANQRLQVVSRLTESDTKSLSFGQSMALVVTPLHEDEEGGVVVSYAFCAEKR